MSLLYQADCELMLMFLEVLLYLIGMLSDTTTEDCCSVQFCRKAEVSF